MNARTPQPATPSAPTTSALLPPVAELDANPPDETPFISSRPSKKRIRVDSADDCVCLDQLSAGMFVRLVPWIASYESGIMQLLRENTDLKDEYL